MRSGEVTTAAGAVLDDHEAWDRLRSVRSPAQAEAAGLVARPPTGWDWRQPATPAARRLADLYTPLCLDEGAYAQLGQSLDGCIATRTGDATFVTGEQDRTHLHRLRALCDAVLVGAGTMVADDPRLTVRYVPGRQPVRVVLDPRGRVPASSGVFCDGAGPTVWAVGAVVADTLRAPADVTVLPLPQHPAGCRPGDVLAALRAMGLHRVLVEGGGVTVSRFLDAGVLRRLYLTVAPLVVGDGVPGLRFDGAARLRDALRPPVRRFDLGPDTLFELDLSADRAARAAPAGQDGRGGDAQPGT